MQRNDLKNLLLAACLLGSLAAAQTSILDIPALPPGKTAPPTSTVPTPAVPTPTPTVTTLPTGNAALKATYTVSLDGPESVQAGEANTWDFTLSNSGEAAIHLEHGACDVRFEVLNAAGEVVRPDPKNGICTMQLVITDVQPGENAVMQKIRWDGKDGRGQSVPAGQYTLRAKFVGAGVFTVPATREITVQ